MSIKVTVRNYMFPLCFSHNGWNVRLEKRIGFFKDLTVEAYFTPPSMPNPTYWNEVLPQRVLSFLINRGLYLNTVPSKDMEQYKNIAQKYVNSIKYPMVQNCRFSANGGLLDRFIGQNISSTQKVVDKIVDYMNHNLPKLEELTTCGYLNHLEKKGVNPDIISALSQICGLLRM